MLDAPAFSFPLRLCGISGYKDRVNDVVYHPPSIRADEQPVLVFFGGDVQDFPEHMQAHRDNKDYIKWNLENTASKLHYQFPEAHIIVVRPAKIELQTFSCFENFVSCNNIGTPDHTPMHYSLQHLEELLQRISEKLISIVEHEITKLSLPNIEVEKVDTTNSNVQESVKPSAEPANEDPFWWRENLTLHKYKLILVGFSKGCVVLNQFLYEFDYFKTVSSDDAVMQRMLSQITDMYWLDGGHSGGTNTWITTPTLLETLVKLGIKIHIHVTPYQINDDFRPWIRKEEKEFTRILQKLEAPVNRVVHFENMFPSLITHFDTLSVFGVREGVVDY